MISRAAANAAFSLLAGPDRGDYTLPDDVTSAGRTYERVRSMRAALTPPAAPLRVLQDVAASLAAGGDCDVDKVANAREALRRFDDEQNILDIAFDLAANNLVSSIRDNADTIITDHLAVAQSDVIDQVRKQAPDFTAIGATRDALFRAADAAREAFDVVSDLAVRFSAIRSARGSVLEIAGATAEPDYRGYFSLIRNAEKVRPDILIKPAADTPWPTDPVGSLLWFAQPHVELWCPTAEQQSERWHEVFPINRHSLVGAP